MQQNKLPSLRKYPHRNYCFVELDGRRIGCGPWIPDSEPDAGKAKGSRKRGRKAKPKGKPSEEAVNRYNVLIAEWLANGRQTRPDPDALTITELFAAYWEHCEAYYGKDHRSLWNYRAALRACREIYGHEPAKDFAAQKLKVVREAMIRTGLARTTVNDRIQVIKRAFKWGAAEGLVTAEVWHNLQVLDGLRKGRTAAKETEGVKPVPQDHVDAVLACLPDVVADMIRIHLLTGARPAEIVGLRWAVIDREGRVWEAHIKAHKTAHHGKTRTLFFGPRAQAILRPYLKREGQLRPADTPIFSPREAMQQRYAECEVHRRPNQKPDPRQTDRTLGDAYTVDSYRRAIYRACATAGIPQWSPNRLRHTAATYLRKEFGLEAAQVILGHSSANITQVYAEVDAEKARKIMEQIG